MLILISFSGENPFFLTTKDPKRPENFVPFVVKKDFGRAGD
jgi:hypothetical protein